MRIGAGVAFVLLLGCGVSAAETLEDALRAGKVATEKFPASELGRQLRSMAPQGVTEGSLYVPPGYQEFPILQ